MTKAVEFRAAIRVIGVNPYVLVSKRIAERVKPGWRKPMPVLVRINGKPRERWRINMMPKGDGSFYLYLHGNVRKASNTNAGDRVHVDKSSITVNGVSVQGVSAELLQGVSEVWDQLVPEGHYFVVGESGTPNDMVRYYGLIPAAKIIRKLPPQG